VRYAATVQLPGPCRMTRCKGIADQRCAGLGTDHTIAVGELADISSPIE
jgi:hypothetical protein